MHRLFRWIGRQLGIGMMKAESQPGDWADNIRQGPASAMTSPRPAAQTKTGGKIDPSEQYNPDEEFNSIDDRPVMNPVVAFAESVDKGESKVSEAWLFEAKFDERGKIIESEEQKSSNIPPYRVAHLESHEAYVSRVTEAKRILADYPAKARAMREAKRVHDDRVAKLKEAGLLREDTFDQDINTSFDQNQYTEYTPTSGGPFFKQLYLTDYLTMHARAFEQWNHHPLAKRIVTVFSQYSFGRRFSWRIKDKKKEKAWEEFDRKYNIRHRISKFWVPEYILYGELFIHKKLWQTIDPSTIWDIVTDPDDITDVYYYHQQYSTAYQQFTGAKVKGVSGAENVKPQDFIIRQLPFDQVIHIKRNCVSNEKRGRSILFPVLGWLKRIKDLYDAEVVSAWLSACFIWDDTVEGSAADIASHVAKYNTMPQTGSVFAHNKMIERKPMQAAHATGRTGAGVGDELLTFIATAVGIPKDFFNVMGQGGGSRATALVGAEPFTKVIEEIQVDIEFLLLNIASEIIPDYKDGDIEFIFPSVTKDTTTETVKNILAGQASGYIAKQTAAQMFAAEMNMTTYDWDDEQNKIDDEAVQLANSPAQMYDLAPMDGSNGIDAKPNGDGPPLMKQHMGGAKDQSPIHGIGKQQLKKQMSNL